MSWSKLHGGAHRHRKVLQLEAALGCSELEARGIVLTVWSWTIESEPDGDLDGWTDDALARVWGWRGDAAGFIAALVSVGLLDREDGALRVHDWMEHAEGWKDADRKRKERQKKRRAPRPENVQDASGTVQGLSGKRPPERRGEERRSEERRGEEIKTPPLPPASGAPPAAPAERAPETLTLVPLEPTRDSSAADSVRAVFAHYRTRHPRSFPTPKSTSKEWSAIAARMREGFSVEDLCAAIDGCHMTPHNLGENDRGEKYLGLELIMRNGSQVTRFAETARNGPPRVVMSTKEMKGHRAMESWLAKKKLATGEQQ